MDDAPQNFAALQKALHYHGLRIDESREELMRFPDFYDLVKGIINTDRHSAKKPKLEQRLKRVRLENRASPETTYMVNFMRAILDGDNFDRMIPPEPHVFGIPDPGQKAWVAQEWHSDKLYNGFVVPMKRGLVSSSSEFFRASCVSFACQSSLRIHPKSTSFLRLYFHLDRY